MAGHTQTPDLFNGKAADAADLDEFESLTRVFALPFPFPQLAYLRTLSSFAMWLSLCAHA